MIPPTIILTHNSAAEASFIGYAKSELEALKTSMSFQGLQQGSSEVSPTDGVLFELSKSFSTETIRITVDESVYLQDDKQKEFKEISTPLDNRFFVRVGAPSDIELDGLGHVIRDDTRYYWIDFFYNTEAPVVSDQIGFYEAGELYSVVETEDTISYDEARDVSDETFLQAITMLDYMRYNVTRSFDLAVTNEQGETTKTNRWVAGYNFLSVGDSIVYAPDIPFPSGGTSDIEGISRHPPNRFVVDLESRTMAWYHVLQRWPEVSTYRECTGSVSGRVVTVDPDNAGSWTVTALDSFSFTGFSASPYGITGTGSETVYEYQCVVADIVDLSRSEVVLNIPYKSEPALLSFDPETAAIISCTGTSELEATKLIATGYEWYEASTYSRESGSQTTIPTTYTDDFNNAPSFSCESYAYDMCPVDVSELVEAHASYQEVYDIWSELHVGISVVGIDPAGWSSINHGENGFVAKQEAVYCRIYYCSVGLNTGVLTCGGNSGERYSSKNLSAYMYANFGTTKNVYAPSQNVSLYLGKRDFVGAVWQLSAQGPPGSTFATFEEAASAWTNPTPCIGEGVWDAATTAFPQNYPVVDPRSYFNLTNMPISMPDLVSSISINVQAWYVPAPADVDTSTDYDICEIVDCPDTKTQSNIVQVSILDDRWSEGSQGIVIAVKSSDASETEIYHDGVAKLNAILTALVRDKLLGAGESLFDIGLI